MTCKYPTYDVFHWFCKKPDFLQRNRFSHYFPGFPSISLISTSHFGKSLLKNPSSTRLAICRSNSGTFSIAFALAVNSILIISSTPSINRIWVFLHNPQKRYINVHVQRPSAVNLI